ncbi:MAG: kinase [Gammaproteobacteria bacterium]|nr:kinase [Gammaproteobacteria bacterium]
MTSTDITAFLSKHRLPQRYSSLVDQWFMSLATAIYAHQNKATSTVIIGVNGAQGSGKSTLTDLLVFLLKQRFKLNAIGLSIDDFYLTKQQRKQLATEVHPLMITRGVPGSHDIELATSTITKLVSGQLNVAIPRFDKASDDRYPPEHWDIVSDKVDIVILEGWCVGAQAQSPEQLTEPLNALESQHDPKAIWRQYVNQKLGDDYPALFDLIDIWIMLKAPSFDCVYAWRLEQEQKLRDTLKDDHATMNDQQIAFFIQHYQRITETILATLPAKVDYLFELNEDRQIIKSIWKDS